VTIGLIAFTGDGDDFNGRRIGVVADGFADLTQLNVSIESRADPIIIMRPGK
jgi:hypothetical protein